MASIFSAQSFLKESSIYSIQLDDKGTYREESFFMEGLDFLTEMQKENVRYRADLYRAVAESGTNMVAVHEAFTDFFGHIKDFIKKVINFFKKLLAKFWVRINSMFLCDKYITKHKDELKKFESKHEFDFNGFEYTFSDNIPSLSVIESVKNAVTTLADEATEEGKSKTFKSKKDIETAYKTFTTEKCESSYLDKQRGSILGNERGIGETEYKDELFKIFRNNEEKKGKITANATLVNKCLYDFEKYSEIKKKTEHQRDEVEKAYNLIEKGFDRIHNAVFGKSGKEVDVLDIVDTADEDRTQLIDMFAKEKAVEVQEISNLHVMAFTAKLDALRDKYAQDKAVMYAAFKKILAKEKMFAKESAELDEVLEHNDIDAIIDTHVRDAVPSEDDSDKKEPWANTDKDTSVADATDSGNNGGECCA